MLKTATRHEKVEVPLSARWRYTATSPFFFPVASTNSRDHFQPPASMHYARRRLENIKTIDGRAWEKSRERLRCAANKRRSREELQIVRGESPFPTFVTIFVGHAGDAAGAAEMH